MRAQRGVLASPLDAARVGLLAALALLLLCPGCVTRIYGEDEEARVESLLARPGQQMTDAQLRLALMRFADEHIDALVLRGEVALYDADSLTTRRAIQYIVTRGTADYVAIAAGPDAELNLLDMVVFTSLLSASLEQFYIPTFGGAGADLARATREANDEIWNLARRLVDPEDESVLRRLIANFMERHPDRRDFSNRFSELTVELDDDHRALAISLISEVEGATREAREVRLVAERVLFLVQRMTLMLTQQIRLDIYSLAMEPEIEGLLQNSDDLVATFVSLPGEFERQRRDSMVEISELLGAQQAALVTTLEDSQAQLGPMLDQLRATLESGNALVASADGLATRLGVGEPGDPDAEGFDLAELQETIVRAESATSSLQRLVESIDALLASDGTGSSVERLQAGSQALESLVDHVYQRALTLVAAAAAALLGVLVIYRLIAVRLLGLV